MGINARTALAALAGAAAVTAGAIAFAGASAAAGPSSAPAVQAGQATCVTDGSGYCTVSHGLGVTPQAIVVSAITPNAAGGYLISTVQGSYTATAFRVRAMAGQDTPKTSGRIWFSYAAYGTSAPATSTPPVTTWTPPTDTPSGPAPTGTPSEPAPGTTVAPTPVTSAT